MNKDKDAAAREKAVNIAARFLTQARMKGRKTEILNELYDKGRASADAAQRHSEGVDIGWEERECAGYAVCELPGCGGLHPPNSANCRAKPTAEPQNECEEIDAMRAESWKRAKPTAEPVDVCGQCKQPMSHHHVGPHATFCLQPSPDVPERGQIVAAAEKWFRKNDWPNGDTTELMADFVLDYLPQLAKHSRGEETKQTIGQEFDAFEAGRQMERERIRERVEAMTRTLDVHLGVINTADVLAILDEEAK